MDTGIRAACARKSNSLSREEFRERAAKLSLYRALPLLILPAVVIRAVIGDIQTNPSHCSLSFFEMSGADPAPYGSGRKRLPTQSSR